MRKIFEDYNLAVVLEDGIIQAIVTDCLEGVAQAINQNRETDYE